MQLPQALKAILLASLLAGTAGSLVACDTNDGPVEELGESIDDAGDDIKDAAEDAADEVEDATN